MGQANSGLYSALRWPALFQAVQNLLVRQDARRLLAAHYIKPRVGDRVLDIGCGTGAMVPFLGDVSFVGVDPEPRYIEVARANHATRGAFLDGTMEDLAEASAQSFDIAIAVGVLHHLDDADARALFAGCYKALKPGGRLVTSDPVRRIPQHPVARLFIRLDRGRSIRSQEGYVTLAKSIFPRVSAELRSDFLRIPYDHCILQCEKEP
jgi:2-polyprenyl-3-methyl-5-hydroxy-6-metoxy-1,4-benzoquinol methylase